MAFAARHRYVINTITDTLNIKDEGLVERCLRVTENYSVLETFFSAKSKGAIYVVVVPPGAHGVGDDDPSSSSAAAAAADDDEFKGNGGYDDPLSLLVVAKGDERKVDAHLTDADTLKPAAASNTMCEFVSLPCLLARVALAVPSSSRVEEQVTSLLFLSPHSFCSLNPTPFLF